MATRRLLDEPERLRRALSPVRRRILARLREPASAAQLAAEFDMPRQRIGYHLRELEAHGLVELVEERRRRGFVERVLRAGAEAYVVDPDVLGERRADVDDLDRHAAEHLLGVTSRTVRDVTRMQTAAEQEGTRLLTFTVETEVRFAQPGDVHRFTDALAAAIGEVVAAFDTPDGRPYRVVGTGHPAPRRSDETEQSGEDT
ncbi:helix-turn-helix domain-containing protein [Spongiactinospora sp. TRM90649]|uniref:ArsR/SmtB family transcription factor n=1 Tax=Spongiactinospora sp. TRM90649 TaxID=3031114 RepID=UPI0023F98B33|nr:helix-turn-helix domain-containing protein [Spongiactinospora sp. TRM90649]MDF5756491.1 helix-turn-helix domain-containing protein [Spongiactinospora sp. TRM90649]